MACRSQVSPHTGLPGNDRWPRSLGPAWVSVVNAMRCDPAPSDGPCCLAVWFLAPTARVAMILAWCLARTLDVLMASVLSDP